MPWGRIDDSLYDHPKLNDLGRWRLPCIGLYTLAISWSNRFLTDGHIPTDQVKRLGGTPLFAEQLVRAGLWDKVADGYRVHDFLDFNPSRREVEDGRKAARERMRRQRRDANGKFAGTSGEVREKFGGSSPAPSLPVPSIPIPVPLANTNVEKSKTTKKHDA
jgi:hypothetical protein